MHAETILFLEQRSWKTIFLQGKSNRIPPSSDNPTLTGFFKHSIPPAPHIRKPTAKNLRNNHSIIIKPSDKGWGICIMNTRDYLSKVHTHIQDHNTYKLLIHDPTNVIAQDVCTPIDYMHSQHVIDSQP